MQLKTLAYLRMRGMFDELRRIGYNPAKRSYSIVRCEVLLILLISFAEGKSL